MPKCVFSYYVLMIKLYRYTYMSDYSIFVETSWRLIDTDSGIF